MKFNNYVSFRAHSNCPIVYEMIINLQSGGLETTGSLVPL